MCHRGSCNSENQVLYFSRVASKALAIPYLLFTTTCYCGFFLMLVEGWVRTAGYSWYPSDDVDADAFDAETIAQIANTLVWMEWSIGLGALFVVAQPTTTLLAAHSSRSAALFSAKLTPRVVAMRADEAAGCAGWFSPKALKLPARPALPTAFGHSSHRALGCTVWAAGSHGCERMRSVSCATSTLTHAIRSRFSRARRSTSCATCSTPCASVATACSTTSHSGRSRTRAYTVQPLSTRFVHSSHCAMCALFLIQVEHIFEESTQKRLQAAHVAIEASELLVSTPLV